MNANDELGKLIPLNQLQIPSTRKPGKRVSRMTLYRWVRSGRLKVVRIGAGVYVTPEEAERLMTETVEEGGPAKARRPRNKRDEADKEWLRKRGVIK